MACYQIEWQERDGGYTEDLSRKYNRKGVAYCNSANDAEPEIWAHPQCPKLGDKAEWDNFARVIDVKCTWRPGTRWRWDVVVTYSSVQNTPTVAKENPLDEAAAVSIDTDLVTEERVTDLDGKPILNTAGDLIKTKIDIPRISIRTKKNVSLVNTWLPSIEGVVNSNAVRIKGILWPAETLKVTKATLSEDKEKNDVGYMECGLEIRHKTEGWETVTINQGFYELVQENPNVPLAQTRLIRKRCVTETGEPEANECFLNAAGQRPRVTYLDRGIRKTKYKSPLEPSDIVLIRIKQFRLFDFNKLPIK